ncbi:MAG: sll0787 family AIR synthase-like protein [Synechococcus sp. TMED20]|jgi:AIR synthase-related protein|nr:MAG: sll0787 family AIR synthase-like protein [Synechococcus sp. TMED20]
MSFRQLVAALRQQSGLLAKRDIQPAAKVFPHLPFPQLGPAGMLGDDAALLPQQTGQLLLACEGMHPGLVDEDPWFAGWSGVLVNLSDIAAMGGRPLALVNSVWSEGPDGQEQLLAGMRFACDRFGVPMVGGHSNQHSPYRALSVAVMGVAEGPVLSARAARPGDELWMLVNQNGSFYRHYPFWDAATEASPASLCSHLSLLPALASAGVVHAAKDISMGGITGTAVMFSEACGHALSIDLDLVQRPDQVPEDAWLTCFPSFGFLLAVDPSYADRLKRMVQADADLICCRIGGFAEGSCQVRLERAEESECFWEGGLGLTGFGCGS